MPTRPAGVKSVWHDDIAADKAAYYAKMESDESDLVTRRSTGPQSAGSVVRVRPYDDQVISPDSTRGSK